MSGPPGKVFVARLAGLVVFESNGDQVGRVRDVVVLLRLGSQQPRVLGLVVEVPPRRPIFIPITRITGIDTGAVITTGTVSLRRFSSREAETLVIGELLDRKVTLAETGEIVTVTDVAMEQTRNQDWLLTKVACVRKAAGCVVAGTSPPSTGTLSPGCRCLNTSRAPPTCSPHSTNFAQPTSPASCTTCPASAELRSLPRWTTSGWPTF